MRRSLAGFAVLFFVAGGQAPLMAAEAGVSECKGLQQTICANNQRCSWVKSYKTAKGREVAAFCRKKPERKQSAQAKAAPSGAQ